VQDRSSGRDIIAAGNHAERHFFLNYSINAPGQTKEARCLIRANERRAASIPAMAGEIRARPTKPGGGRRDPGQGRPIQAVAGEIRAKAGQSRRRPARSGPVRAECEKSRRKAWALWGGAAWALWGGAAWERPVTAGSGIRPKMVQADELRRTARWESIQGRTTRPKY
jgi:hypothetical protein